MKKSDIKLAINLLKENQVVIIPTDTIYGISALASEENRVKINKIKKSDLSKPLITLVSSIKQIPESVKISQELINILKSKEPTTVIIPLTNSKNTLAVRLVKKKYLKKIIKKVGPIFSTSANFSKNDYVEDKEIFESLGIKIEKVFYSKKLNNRPSTIINFIDKSKKR
ncbi:L-threonylcarbamoyladenylate synthase [Spiroplasma alleghenense]|uniref:L-threonylcarbamoyladenylate synthase n=1 Tax=Spiroplasma alleghenense TaxID=216931 RepID=A0A345Z2U0_9MOLU|nr:Sua5/YciO/YrdC/YwlC family protein [Spiroplasma alleghenense]AXK50919.1 L-threonylcarbamoyladenylate synthase [Spiroplasma alleghenense]